MKALVSSGIRAAASVPQEMMVESFHHIPAPRFASIQFETRKVTTIDSNEVVHTRLVSGASKSILSLPRFRARATAPFTLKATIDVMIIRTRMAKIQTRKWGFQSGITARAMKEMSATPVTP